MKLFTGLMKLQFKFFETVTLNVSMLPAFSICALETDSCNMKVSKCHYTFEKKAHKFNKKKNNKNNNENQKSNAKVCISKSDIQKLTVTYSRHKDHSSLMILQYQKIVIVFTSHYH
jgi:hypothetical protein